MWSSAISEAVPLTDRGTEIEIALYHCGYGLEEAFFLKKV